MLGIIIGEIVQVYCEEKSLSDNKPDYEKIDPLLFFMPEGPYLKTGNVIAKAFDVGRDLKLLKKKLVVRNERSVDYEWLFMHHPCGLETCYLPLYFKKTTTGPKTPKLLIMQWIYLFQPERADFVRLGESKAK